MKRSPRRTLVSLFCASALVLSACGDDDDSSDPSTTADSQAASSTTEPADTTTTEGANDTDDSGQDDPTTTTSSTPDSTPAVDDTAWRSAIATAEEHAGGTAYELDDQDDNGTWEIDVAVGDRSVEVTVSADGTSVVETEDDDDLDDDDRQALSVATITLEDAILTALAEVPGQLDDAELDDDNGTFAWEITIDVDNDDDVEVYIDVVTGEVLRVERD